MWVRSLWVRSLVSCLKRSLVLSDQSSTLINSFNLNYFSKGPHLQTQSDWLGVMTSAYEFGGGTNINNDKWLFNQLQCGQGCTEAFFKKPFWEDQMCPPTWFFAPSISSRSSLSPEGEEQHCCCSQHQDSLKRPGQCGSVDWALFCALKGH